MSLLEPLNPAVPEGRSSLGLPGTQNFICLLVYASASFTNSQGGKVVMDINGYKMFLYSSYLHEAKWKNHCCC